MKVPSGIVDILETIQWAEENFGSLVTTRQVTRRDIMRCVDRKLAKSVGMVLVCDADGGIIEPEREREGFKLTKKGRETLKVSR